MLRLIFVFIIILAGLISSLWGPFYALLFYLWYAYFRPERWVWTDVISPLKISLFTGAYLVITSIFALKNFRLSKTVVLIMLFFIQSALSLLTAENPEWSTRYWIEFAKVLTVALVMTFLVSDKARYRLTLLVIAYSLGLESAKQGWAQMILNPGAQNNNPHPALGDNNGMALGMMMLIPVFIALAQTARYSWERFLHRFFIVGLFYRGISTYSRGGFLAAAVLGLISFSRSARKVRALLATAVLVAIVVLVMPPRFWDRMETIWAPGEKRDEAAGSRLYFWQVALRMAKAKPLLGIGFNGYRASFSAYDISGGAYGEDRAVHSAWFGALAEMGCPGLIFLVTVLVVALGTCARIRQDTRGDPSMMDIRSYASGLQTSFITYAVAATFLNQQYNEMFWHFIGLSAALDHIHASVRSERSEGLQDEAVSADISTKQADLRS